VYELRFDKDEGTGELVRQGHSADMPMLGDPTEDTLEDRREKLITARLEHMQAIQAVLGTLYHLPPPAFLEPWDEEGHPSFICKLIEVADYYGCASVVKVHVQNYFQQCRDEVVTTCSEDALDLLPCAISAECEWVVLECCAWVISKPTRSWEAHQRRILALGSVGKSIIAARRVFQQRLMEVDLRLLRLQHPDQGTEHRVSAYTAVNFLRQWLVARQNQGQGSDLGPDYAKVYREIAESKVALHLTKTKLGGRCAPTSDDVSDGLLEDTRVALRDILKAAVLLVKPLLVDFTAYDEKKHSPGPPFDPPMTVRFMTIPREELPWIARSKTSTLGS